MQLYLFIAMQLGFCFQRLSSHNYHRAVITGMISGVTFLAKGTMVIFWDQTSDLLVPSLEFTPLHNIHYTQHYKT